MKVTGIHGIVRNDNWLVACESPCKLLGGGRDGHAEEMSRPRGTLSPHIFKVKEKRCQG